MSAPFRTRRALPRPAEELAEKALAEDVAEGAEDVGNVAELRLGAAEAGVAEAVVAGPLLGMAEDLERLGGLLELDDRFFIPGLRSGWYLSASRR